MKQILFIALVAIIMGCGAPPKEEIGKAKAAKSAADAVKAADYAKESYDDAIAMMDAGKEAEKKSEWEKAKKAYIDAAAKFEYATKEAPVNMKERVKTKIDNAKKLWNESEKDKSLIASLSKLKKDVKDVYEKQKENCKKHLDDAIKFIEQDDFPSALEAISQYEECMSGLKSIATPVKK